MVQKRADRGDIEAISSLAQMCNGVILIRPYLNLETAFVSLLGHSLQKRSETECFHCIALVQVQLGEEPKTHQREDAIMVIRYLPVTGAGLGGVWGSVHRSRPRV